MLSYEILLLYTCTVSLRWLWNVELLGCTELSFQLHIAQRYYFLPKKLKAHTEAFLLPQCRIISAISISIKMRFWHPAVESRVEMHKTVGPVSNRCFGLVMLVWETIHWSVFMGSLKAAFNVSVGIKKNVSRGLLEQGLGSCEPQAPLCTWPAGVGERVRGLTTHSFPFWHLAFTLSAPLQGAGRSEWSLYSGNMQLCPPEELLLSLAHVKAFYHLSPSPFDSLMLALLAFPPVRSVFTGACKITWQEPLKALDRANVPSAPQTFTDFFVSLKWRVHRKEVHVFLCQRVNDH